MGYFINLTGDGADPDDVKEIVETTVRALRAVTPVAPAKFVTGSAGGSGPDGEVWALAAADVVDLEAVDPDELDDAGETDPEAEVRP